MPAAMRLLCVLNGDRDHPSTRFRVLQHVETLRAGGIEADLLVAKRGAGYGLLDLRRRARAADAVLIQKKLLASWKLALVPRRAPVLFDLDDAIFEISPDEERRFGPVRAARRMRSRRGRLEAVTRRADVVVAGNRYLASWVARSAARVEIVPTGVDLGPFPAARLLESAARRRSGGGERLIGWIGSRPSLPYLAAIAGPLAEVCARHPGTRLVQVCDGFIDLPGVPTEKRRWSIEREAADLLDLDIGLMPIDDRPFSRGKCGLKILQYHAAGLPVVCAPVGANAEIVRDGVSGFHATDDRSWIEGMERLLGDPGTAAAMGAAGRARVEADYSSAVVGRRLLAIVSSVLERGAREVGRTRRAASALEPVVEEPEGDQEPEQNQRLLIPDHLAERPAIAPAPGIGGE
jgi:glycosyl transferase family 1